MSDRRRSADYREARIGAAVALVGVLVVLLLWDALSNQYEMQPVTLAALLTTIGTLLGLEISDQLGIVRRRREEDEEEDKKDD